MINPEQLLQFVIQPTLKAIGLYSVEAERLVLGTACQETECGRYLHQIGGPGLGIYSMEPDTYYDLWVNFLAYRSELASKVRRLAAGMILANADELMGNLYLATAMCRVHYFRDKEKIPFTLSEQAQYYKRVYNTERGAATTDQYIANWRRLVGAEWT